MVFRVAGNHTVKARCETMEMPFRGFWDEKLHQPIFGTNNLTGTLMYYDNQPFQGDLTVKLIFNEGGVGTFLHVFNNVLRATRIQMNRERISNSNSNSAAYDPAPIPVAENPSAPPPEPSRYMQQDAAFVDPHDPSQIYTTTQPDINMEERREEQPAWAPSSGGMRRRRNNNN